MKIRTAEHGAPDDPLLILFVDLLEKRAHAQVRRGEIPRHQSAAYAQQDEERYLPEFERICGSQRHGQNRVEAPQHEGHRRGRDRGDEQRNDRSCGDVEHQDFQHEHHARDRSLENGGQRRAGAAAEQQRGVLVVEPRDPSDVRADGGSRQHDGGLRTHRTAESDGRGAAHDRGPAVVARDARIAARHGVEYARDALRNVVPDDVFDEQRRQNDADGGVDQEQDVGDCPPETSWSVRI